MGHVNELVDILQQNFNWNKARLRCFAGMLIGLMAVRTVNLTGIANAFYGSAKTASNYRRMQRFFSEFEIGYRSLARFIFRLFSFAEGKLFLTMDRTNWQWGKRNINILVLAVVYQGIAVPIFWKALDKKGNSDTSERIELMKEFIECFGKECILGILADREFIGKKWFAWLMDKEIPFYIRLKGNYITTNSRGEKVKINTLFYGLQVNERRTLEGKRNLWGHEVYLSGLRMENGEVLIVATNTSPEQAIENYAKRWEIETLFACLKERGFNFEDTHITELNRIERLMALLAIAFCWAHKNGQWLHKQVKPIKIKKHGRLAKSIFRYGLDFIREAILKLSYKYDDFKKCLLHILPTLSTKRPCLL